MKRKITSVTYTPGSRSRAGFTLIELLVVIAIIGILAAIVLASLSTAKSKGQDASLEEEMGNLRSQAELYTGATTAVTAGACSNGTANLFGAGSGGLGALIGGIIASAGSANTECYYAGTTLPSAGAKWAVAATLPSGTGYWCTDYTGRSASKNTNGASYASLSGTGATAAFNTSTSQCN